MRFLRHQYDILTSNIRRLRRQSLTIFMAVAVLAVGLLLTALGAGVIVQAQTDATVTPNPQYLYYSQTTTGQIDTDTSQDWYFVGAPGDIIRIQAIRTTGNLLLGVTVYDQTGRSLAGVQAVDSGSAALSDVGITQSAVYTIHVTGLAHTSGAYQITLNNTATIIASPTPVSQVLAGSVVYGQTVHGAVDDVNYRQVWKFTGTLGDVIDVQMRVTSGNLLAFVALISPSGDVITTSAAQIGNASATQTRRDATIFSIQLASTGSYQLLARRQGDQQGKLGIGSGLYDLTITNHALTANAQDTILQPGTELTGRLTTSVPISQYQILSGGIFVFRLNLENLHRIARIRLLDSNGVELNSQSGVSPLTVIVSLPPKGPFSVQISADSFDDQLSTDFSLNLYKITSLAVPIDYGSVLRGQAGHSPDQWVFIGHAGDLIRLHVAPDSDAGDATVALSGPQNITIFQGTIGPAFDQAFTLPTDGTYQVAVQTATIDAPLLAYQITLGWEGVSGLPFARFGVTASSGALGFTNPLTGTLPPLGSQTWTIDATVGQTINITTAAQTLAQSLGILIRAPDESLIAMQYGHGIVQLRRALLPVTGRYSLVVFNPSTGQPVPYTVQLEDAGGGLLNGTAVKGVVLPSNTFAEWSLDISAGALITAQLTTRTPAAWTPGLILLDPSGLILSRVGIGSDRTTLDLTGIRALKTGRYRLVVVGSVGAAFASYELHADTQLSATASANSSELAAPPTTAAPTIRFAGSPAAVTSTVNPTLPDMLDPALPFDPSPTAVQTMPFDTLLRGEISVGAIRQVWRAVTAGGITLNFRAVSIDNLRGPDLALFDAKQNIVAEQLHNDSSTTTLTYFTVSGGPYYLAVRLGLGNGRYTLYAESQALTLGPLQTALGTPLLYGQTATGELVTADQPTQVDNYYFFGAANDVITFSAARITGDLAPAVQISTLSGKVLSGNANAANVAVSAITAFSLPINSVYVIQVRRSATAQNSQGRYFLALDLLSSIQLKNQLYGILQPNQTVSGLLSVNIPQNTWLIKGRAGQPVSFTVTGLSERNGPAPLSLKLQDIAGNTFAQQDIFALQDSAQLVDALLPNDGLYRVQVTGGNLTEGSYRLQWLPQTVRPSGALQFGQTVSGLFTATQQAEKWTFSGTVGDVIALSLRQLRGDPFRGAFQILSASGVTLASAADLGNGEGARVDSLSLPFSGTYTVVVVNPDSSFKGTSVYALGLTLQNTKARAVGGLLADGQTGISELYPDDPVHTWLFSGHGGDVVTVQAAAQDHFLQPQITLQNTNDQPLTKATAGVGGVAVISAFKLPADGVYAVAVTGAAKSSGSYRISLAFASPPPAALATIKYGDSSVGLIADDRQTNLFLFSGQPGDLITAQVAREAGSNLALTLELHSENGALLARSDGLGGETAAITNFALPDSGVYRLIVGRFGGAEGHTSGRLTITLNGNPANLPIRGTIKSGQLEQGRLDDTTPTDRWTFDGKAGQVVSITSKATSGDLDTFLTLQTSDKKTIASNDDFDGTNAALPGVILPTDGTYTITISRVGTHGHGSAGNYDLHLVTLFAIGSKTTATSVPINYGQRVVGTIDSTHPETHWAFEAQAGDVVQVLLAHSSDDAPPTLSIQDPSGSVLISGVLAVGQTTIDRYQIPVSGLFDISVKRPINAHAAYSPYALTLTLLSSSTNTDISTGGLLPIDGSVIGQLDATHALNLWLIQAASGQTFALNLTPLTGNITADVQIVDPGGRLLLTQSATLDNDAHDLRIGPLVMPVGGLYAVMITPHQADQSGTYRIITHLTQPADQSLSIQTLTPSQTAKGALTDLHTTDRWQLQGTAGQTINAQLLAVSGTWQPLLQLIGADGQFIAASRLDQTPFGLVAVIQAASIPTDGRYTLLVGRSGSGGGSYALTYGVGSAVSVQTLAALPIRYGQTIQAVSRPAQVDLWAFDAQASDVVDVIVQPGAVGAAGTVLDAPSLKVEDTAGHVIIQAAPVGHESDAASLALPGPGRYIIALNSDNVTGYSLTLQNRPTALSNKFATRTLVNGKTLQNGIDSGSLTDYWAFNGQAGDGIQLKLARLSGDLRLNVSLYGPNGYISGAAADAKTASLTLGALRLPDTGLYTVVVGRWLNAAGKTSGGYQITLTSVNAPSATAAPTLPQSSVSAPIASQPAISLTNHGVLPLNTSIEADLSTDQIGHVWTFDAQASPTVAAEVVSESASLTLHVVLVAANGLTIGHADTGVDGHLTIEAPLTVAGRYSLQILPNTPGETGHYRVQLSYALAPLGGGRLVGGLPVNGTLSDGHFTDNWRFVAPKDSLVQIDAHLTAGAVGLAYVLLDPNGQVISPAPDANTNQSAITVNSLQVTLRAPSNGTYTLLMTRQGGASLQALSSYQLMLQIALPTF